jgi:hypothetical protein
MFPRDLPRHPAVPSTPETRRHANWLEEWLERKEDMAHVGRVIGVSRKTIGATMRHSGIVTSGKEALQTAEA